MRDARKLGLLQIQTKSVRAHPVLPREEMAAVSCGGFHQYVGLWEELGSCKNVQHMLGGLRGSGRRRGERPGRR